MLVSWPETGFHSTASLPTVVVGHENSSTSPVCSMTAWIETRVRLNGAVHDPLTAGSAAMSRGRLERPLCRAGPPIRDRAKRPPISAAAAPPATRNRRRPNCPAAVCPGIFCPLSAGTFVTRSLTPHKSWLGPPNVQVNHPPGNGRRLWTQPAGGERALPNQYLYLFSAALRDAPHRLLKAGIAATAFL